MLLDTGTSRRRVLKRGCEVLLDTVTSRRRVLKRV